MTNSFVTKRPLSVAEGGSETTSPLQFATENVFDINEAWSAMGQPHVDQEEVQSQLMPQFAKRISSNGSEAHDRPEPIIDQRPSPLQKNGCGQDEPDIKPTNPLQ